MVKLFHVRSLAGLAEYAGKRRFGKKNQYNHAGNYKGNTNNGRHVECLVINYPANQCEQGYANTGPDGIGDTEWYGSQCQ